MPVLRESLPRQAWQYQAGHLPGPARRPPFQVTFLCLSADRWTSFWFTGQAATRKSCWGVTIRAIVGYEKWIQIVPR